MTEATQAPRRLAAGILLGGRSRRMGTAKALLPLAGRTFVEAVAEALDGVAGEIVLLGAGLVPKPLERLRRLADAPGVDGPLGGVLAALRSEPGADWLVAACDQPLLTGEAVSWLVAEAGRSEAVALLARREPSRVEPFPGFFARASLPLLEALAARGERSLQPLAREAGVAAPEIPADLAAAWTSIDTPEAFAALLGAAHL